MFISLIFFYSAVELSFVNSFKSNCNGTLAITELDGFNNHVLRRRIRSLVFPSKAQFLLTLAFSKAVLDGRPGGLLYAVEFDMSYPLPDTIESWKPTLLSNKLKDKVTTSEPLKANLPQKRKDSGTYNKIFNNSTEDVIQPYLLYDYYNFTFPENNAMNDFNLEWKPRASNFPNRNFKINSNKVYSWAANFHKHPYSKKKYRRSSSNLSMKCRAYDCLLAEKFFDDLQYDRERELIHQQLETFAKIFKINMKKCIHRAICELSSELRMYGESVLEDIIRIILIPPHRSNIPIGRGNNSNTYCKKKFAVSCPYNIFGSLANIFNSRA